MLRDYRELAKTLVDKFISIKKWPEILFDEEAKEKIKEIKDITIVNNSSIQFDFKDNHCIIPSQYVLYTICIKEFALALREHLDVFDRFKQNNNSNFIGSAILNNSFDNTSLGLDDYSKKIVFKPLIDSGYNLEAKSIVNGSQGKYKIRGTSDFFQSVVLKIIDVPDASSQQLGKFIYNLTSNIELYNFLEKKYIKYLPYIVKSSVRKDFARDVLTFLYQYDRLSVIEKYLKVNNDKKHWTLFDDGIKLSSIFRISDSIQSETDLTRGNDIRFYEEPIGINDKNKYMYLSSEWTQGKESRLDLNSFRDFINNYYPEFYINIQDNNYSLLPRNNFKISRKDQIDFNIVDFQESTKKARLNFSEILITRFVSSLCTKPFVLLSGLSGSGKTKLAQCFAQWISEDESQYKILPVGADWTNREPLLGFPNALNSEEYVMPENGVLNLLIEANKPENSSKPYFLILDEMNLSHVERYFADFLSVMESGKGISLHSSSDSIIGVPKKVGEVNNVMVPNEIEISSNLFIIGTVNIDETTYMFSPKVLDRANTIEFRLDEHDIKEYLEEPTIPVLEILEHKGANMALDFLNKSKITSNGESNKNINTPLLAFFRELKKSGAEFGYRTAGEIYRLITQLGEINKDFKFAENINRCLDIAIMQKLLPKVHGSRRKLDPILKTLATFCVEDGKEETAIEFLSGKDKNDYSKNVKFPISLEKIVRMYNGAVDNGFASYAEA